jgi:hypothetical protein
LTVELTTSASVELLKLFYDRFNAWDMEAVLAVMHRDVIAAPVRCCSRISSADGHPAPLRHRPLPKV